MVLCNGIFNSLAGSEVRGGLPAEVLPRVLEQLGPSLATAVPCCRAVADAAAAENGVAYRPLSLCEAVPSPVPADVYGHFSKSPFPAALERCGLVLRRRRKISWKQAAKMVCTASIGPCNWGENSVRADAKPTHRRNVALCGASGPDERVLIFGGNTSHSGAWRTSSELFLADLPGTARGPPDTTA